MKLFNFGSNFLRSAKIQSGSSSFKFSFRTKIVTLWIIALFFLVLLLFFRNILPVFIWAAVTAYIFNPMITFFAGKTKMPRILWVIVLYIVLGIIIFWALKSLTPLISNEISDLVSGSLDEPNTFLGRIASQKNISFFGAEISLRDQVMAFSGWVKSQIPLQAIPLFFGTVGKLVFLLIYFVVAFYFILESGSYITWLKAIIPHAYRKEISDLLENVDLTLGAYLRAQVVLIIIMSVLSFIVLSLLEVKYSLMLSITTGVLEVIPIAGPICATAIATTVAMFQIGTPFGISNITFAILVVCAYFALRQFEDYFIIPNVMSRFVKVHPVVAIFALMAGGTIGGVLGLFLAIPAAAILKVFFEYLYLKLTEEKE